MINGAAYPAPVVSQRATEAVIQKAKEHGFGIVGVHNTFSSNGAQAYYAEKIARQNLIGIVCSRSPASTAGFDSIDPIFGTNPIGFGFPTSDEPLVFDMATSAMTFYGLILAKARGERIPDNMAIDAMATMIRMGEMTHAIPRRAYDLAEQMLLERQRRLEIDNRGRRGAEILDDDIPF